MSTMTCNFRLWNNYMAAYDLLTQVDSYQKNIEMLAGAFHPLPGKRILDAGSGTGNLCMLLKSRGAAPVACDFSPSALKCHREKDPSAEQVQASLEAELPFSDQSFDGICCASVLFTLSKAGCNNAVHEFFRLLKPSGEVVITVPTTDAKLAQLLMMTVHSMRMRYGLALGMVMGAWNSFSLMRVMYYNYCLRSLPDWSGMHFFTEQELTELLSGAGFRDIEASRTYGGYFHLVRAKKC